VYCGPDGEKVPLELNEVIPLQMPNPNDPYRGMGPVQALLADLDSTRYAAEWNRNFFLNSAEPGGIIATPNMLDDKDFEKLRKRWSEQHKGVAGAHRVAILEGGLSWQTNAFSMRDMQFTQLRQISRDVIMEAYGISKFAIGILDDVNRATADASKAWFGEYKTIPRLERIKGALNNNFLPMFGATGKGLMFDYDNPVPANREEENAELNAKVTAYVALVGAGVDPDEAADVVGIPRMKMKSTAVPVPVPANGHRPGLPALPKQSVEV
jgi:HK97 family phage portal protein